MIKIVKVGASWCAPCRRLAPIFNKIADDIGNSGVVFESLSDNHNEERWEKICEKFKVRQIPATLILNENDELIDRLNGFQGEGAYREWIKKHIPEPSEAE
jgi:thioredoxin 1